MYVCLCHKVTDTDIRRLVQTEGVTSMSGLREHLGVATQCGKCSCSAKEVLQDAVADLRSKQRCASALSVAA